MKVFQVINDFWQPDALAEGRDSCGAWMPPIDMQGITGGSVLCSEGQVCGKNIEERKATVAYIQLVELILGHFGTRLHTWKGWTPQRTDTLPQWFVQNELMTDCS